MSIWYCSFSQCSHSLVPYLEESNILHIFTSKILSFLRIWHVLQYMFLDSVLPTWSGFKQGVGAVVCYLLLQIASVLYYWGQWGRFWIVPTTNTCQNWVCATWMRRRKKVKVNMWTCFQDLSSYSGGCTANFVKPQGRVQRNLFMMHWFDMCPYVGIDNRLLDAGTYSGLLRSFLSQVVLELEILYFWHIFWIHSPLLYVWEAPHLLSRICWQFWASMGPWQVSFSFWSHELELFCWFFSMICFVFLLPVWFL